MNTVYRFDQADVVVSLDADFVCAGPGHVRYARDFASRRVIEGPTSTLNRLYVVESMTTSTGAIADHRRRCARAPRKRSRAAARLLPEKLA